MLTEIKKTFLTSVIMPAYDAQNYIEQAVQSVLRQTHTNIELLIINDGSTDSTEEIVFKIADPRIKYFKQQKGGVSAARNVGLSVMTGDFFCFLDADDCLPQNSLMSRIDLFQNPEINFIDGKVLKMNGDMTQIKSKWSPDFQGNPLNDLVSLAGKSFFGPTWLIRRDKNRVYKFKEGLSHGEDLLFFMELARTGGDYTFVKEPILHYRDTAGSAMKNLKGLENGYRYVEKEIGSWPEFSTKDLIIFKLKWRKFMALDYAKRGQIIMAFGLMR